jgi:hypothetical protein
MACRGSVSGCFRTAPIQNRESPSSAVSREQPLAYCVTQIAHDARHVAHALVRAVSRLFSTPVVELKTNAQASARVPTQHACVRHSEDMVTNSLRQPTGRGERPRCLRVSSGLSLSLASQPARRRRRAGTSGHLFGNPLEWRRRSTPPTAGLSSLRTVRSPSRTGP